MNGNGSNGNGNGNGHFLSGGRWWSSFFRKAENGHHGNDYRRLSLQLHFDLPEGARSALLVSPTQTPLLAQASTYLAMSLAEELMRPVVLVDASPVHGDVTRLLGYSANGNGAGTEQSFANLLLPTSSANLSFIPSTITSRFAAAGAADRLGAFMDEAATQSDFVLFAGGSVRDEPLVRALAPRVGCVLLLAAENETKVSDLEAAQETLSACRAKRVVLVLSEQRPRGDWSHKHLLTTGLRRDHN